MVAVLECCQEDACDDGLLACAFGKHLHDQFPVDDILRAIHTQVCEPARISHATASCMFKNISFCMFVLAGPKPVAQVFGAV